MQGHNWKLGMLLAATVGVMSSASSVAIAQSDVQRQQPQGLRDTDNARQQPQGLRDTDTTRQEPQGLRDAGADRQQPQGLKDGEAPPAPAPK